MASNKPIAFPIKLPYKLQYGKYFKNTIIIIENLKKSLSLFENHLPWSSSP